MRMTICVCALREYVFVVALRKWDIISLEKAQEWVFDVLMAIGVGRLII